MPFGMPDFDKLNESAEKMVKASEKTIKFSEKLIAVMNITNDGLKSLNKSIENLTQELKKK